MKSKIWVKIYDRFDKAFGLNRKTYFDRFEYFPFIQKKVKANQVEFTMTHVVLE